MTSRILSVVLTTAFVFTASPARAGVTVAREQLVALALEDPLLVEAERLFLSGKAKFDTSDFKGAIADWQKAYASLPDEDEYIAIRNDLVYNISAAQIEAYEVDSDVSHLRQAKRLLEYYQQRSHELSGPEVRDSEEWAKVEARIDELERRIAAAEGTRKPRRSPKISKLTWIGAGLGAGAIVFGIVAISGLVRADTQEEFNTMPDQRDQARRDNKIGNRLAIATGALSGALAITAAVLITVGVRKSKKSQVAVAPGGIQVRF